MKVNLGPNVLLLTGIAVAIVYIVYCWQDITKGNLTGSFSVQQSPISATVTPASSVRCNRISLPARFYNATTAPYNPAAMRHPVTGNWFLVHNFDEVAFSLSDMVQYGTNLGQLLNTHPLLLKLGSWNSLSLQHTTYDEVAMLEYDDSYLRAAREAGATYFKCGDWSGGRPFAWRGNIYLAHWIYFARGEERMAISAIDEAAGLVRLAHVLSPLARAVEAAQRTKGHQAAVRAASLSYVAGSTYTREKNWGLVADRGELVLYHVLLPCTVVLAFDLSDGNATAVNNTARVVGRACYTGAAEVIARATGLDILRHPIHGSGNPVPWDIDHGAEHGELLGMLHVKLGDYAHWPVRIDRRTRRVTHLSAGPVVKARDYRNEGFLDSALVVGSFHVMDRVTEEGQERVVRMLYGEGDRFGCWLDVAADAIAWHALGEPDAGATLPQLGAPAPEPEAAAALAAAAAEKPARPEPVWEGDQWLERRAPLRLTGVHGLGNGTGVAPASGGYAGLVRDLASGARGLAHGRGARTREGRRRDRDTRRAGPAGGADAQH